MTQQFNTTHSMGRLTLNILLSFAQFEREIISERTRDKIFAARRRGKWTGGRPILGYDIERNSGGSRLVVNEAEAQQVRQVFGRYLETRSMLATLKWLDRQGWTNKQYTDRKKRYANHANACTYNGYKYQWNTSTIPYISAACYNIAEVFLPHASGSLHFCDDDEFMLQVGPPSVGGIYPVLP